MTFLIKEYGMEQEGNFSLRLPSILSLGSDFS
jgi:hypothetical protein